MSESDAQAAAQKQRILLALTKLRAEIDDLKRARREPIAIVGMSARFPGAPDADAFWDLLRRGGDGITEVPPDRWSLDELYDPDPDAVGKMYTRFGGFLQDIDQFDAAFFGISPREATAMDPQHRMLLEAAWHALEDAAIAPDSLRDQSVGVYLGMCATDYGSRALSGDTRSLDAWFGQGISFSTAAGRVSYVLGTHGPSLSLDTACSSSLVAIDLASRSLRDGQCSAALVGAASVILVPQGMINFCQARVLAPDGRCKSFDAAGDGYVRSEGVAMVVLKRLSDATAAGDRILGVIRGVAVQHHGRSSSLTAPNGPAQERVMREALQAAELDPAAVDYVEAHGTGTSLGDSIEFAAMARTFTPGRTASHPLRIGCVKSNIGHTEGPAGLAGLIKVLHAFEHEALPPTIHLRTPSPLLDQPDPPIQIPRTLDAWPRGARPRVAGVSAFSLSGTNAHVVVAEPPAVDPPAGTDEPMDQVLVLSARSEASLSALQARYRAWLSGRTDNDWRSICFTAAVGRAHLPYRLAIVASSPGEAITALDAGSGQAGVLESGQVPRVAMVFAGQGVFCREDVRRLYSAYEVFRRTIDACETLGSRGAGVSLLDAILGDTTERLSGFPHDAALFTIEAALYRLWEHWGVRPHAVAGHGLGEYVAAHVAGILSLDDAFTLLRARAALLEPFDGRTASILALAPSVDVRRVLGARPDVSIAAINTPTMAVVSGERTAVEQAGASLAAAGIRVSALPESTAAQTGLVDQGLDQFEAAIRGLASGPARLRLISGLTGTALSVSQRCDASYWRRQVREPVRFDASIQALHTNWHCDTFLEIGPSGAFVSLARESLPAVRDAAWIPSLTTPRQGARDLQHALGRLYIRGVAIDWRGVHAGAGRRRLRVPAYPFDRRRYWLAGISAPDDSSSTRTVPATAAPRPAAPAARAQEDGALSRVMGMTPVGQRLALLRQLLKTRLSALLGFESTTALEDHRPLNEIGLNSLMALQLKSELDRGIGTVIPLAALFEHVTVDALARFLGRTYFDVADAEDLEPTPLRLRDEVVLPDDIRVAEGMYGSVDGGAAMRAVLLTGATGYLGAYLLRSLLGHTTAVVHCLVRGQSPSAARERLIARQREIDGWHDDLAARIVAVAGDLAEPRFGLDPAAYATLAGTIDVVYHTAATVNFVLPYQALKRTTVGGTIEALRFCATGRPKPLHYVGTIAVLLSEGFQAMDRLPEQEDLGDGSGLPMGYAQAKWVAEQLVLTARARGLSTTVYRPGFIGGHSGTGDCKLDDLIPRLAQGCVELGCAPDFGGNIIDFSPVDYVSDAVVRLSLRPNAAGGLFHLTHPSPTPWARFVERMREHGYDLESLPYQEWLSRLQTLSETSALRGLVPFFEGMPSSLLRLPPAECARAQRALAGEAPPCPDHAVLLDRYLDYFWRIGWIPRPAARA